MKSPYKSLIVTSDNNQVTQFSHRHMQMSTPLVSCLADDMLLKSKLHSHQVPLNISNVEYDSAIDTLLHDAPDFTVNWIQMRTNRWLQARGNEIIFDCMP